jgi:hypothetical protein
MQYTKKRDKSLLADPFHIFYLSGILIIPELYLLIVPQPEELV